MNYNQYYLIHHGIPGQKWGIRRFQNLDGSLTEAGKKRYLNVSSDGSVYLSRKGKKFEPVVIKQASIDALNDTSRWDVRNMDQKEAKRYLKLAKKQKDYEYSKLNKKDKLIANALMKNKDLLKLLSPMSFSELDEDEDFYKESYSDYTKKKKKLIDRGRQLLDSQEFQREVNRQTTSRFIQNSIQNAMDFANWSTEQATNANMNQLNFVNMMQMHNMW